MNFVFKPIHSMPSGKMQRSWHLPEEGFRWSLSEFEDALMVPGLCNDCNGITLQSHRNHTVSISQKLVRTYLHPPRRTSTGSFGDMNSGNTTNNLGGHSIQIFLPICVIHTVYALSFNKLTRQSGRTQNQRHRKRSSLMTAYFLRFKVSMRRSHKNSRWNFQTKSPNDRT